MSQPTREMFLFIFFAAAFVGTFAVAAMSVMVRAELLRAAAEPAGKEPPWQEEDFATEWAFRLPK